MGNDNVKDYPPYLDYPKPRKPTTNADKLRSMRDEELAELWWRSVDCEECPVYYKCRQASKDCVRLALDWLREEAKDGS